MAALVIESFPETLHAKLTRRAASHQRSVAQETIDLIEAALNSEAEPHTLSADETAVSKWARRQLLPEYEALLLSGALSGGTDSTQMISEDRDEP